MRHATLITWLLVAFSALAGRGAHAQQAPQAPDRPQVEGGEARYAIDRTSLYGDDARTPAPMTVIATASVSYTNIGADPTYLSSPYPKQAAGCFTSGGVPHPCYSTFAGNTAQPGGTTSLSGELGLFTRLSVLGSVMVGFGGTGGIPSPDVGGAAALRFRLLPDSWTHTHLVVTAGYVREAYNPPVYDDDRTPAVWLPGQSGGINAGYFQVAMSGDAGRLRLGGTFHGQHTFADGRDPLDVMVDLGASYRVAGTFRAGLEYVGQDLEETFSPGAEGGPRHFLGPVASLQLLRERITIVGGPSIGLSSLSPDFVARVAVSAAF